MDKGEINSTPPTHTESMANFASLATDGRASTFLVHCLGMVWNKKVHFVGICWAHSLAGVY